MVTGTKPDEGWAWVVLLGSFGAHILNGTFLFCVGIVQAALLEKYEESVTYTSWTTSLAICLMSSAGPLASFCINRFNCRITTITGGLMVAIGCLTSAFMPTLNWIFLTYSVMAGVGVGMAYNASVVTVGFGFEKNRNFATGLAASGAGIGILFLAPAITAAKTTYGYEGLLIIIAGLGFHYCLFGTLFRPSQLEIHVKNLQIKRQMDKSIHSKNCTSVLSYFSVLRNKSLLCFCISILCWTLGVFLIVLHLPVYSVSKNASPLQASFLLSLAGACGCFSRILTGLASNSENISELIIYVGSYGILGVASLLFPLYGTTYRGQLVFAAIFGLYSGNCYGILSSINIRFVGIENIATAYGLEMFFHGLGSLIGPPIAGLIVDEGGTYEESFMIAGIAIVLGAVLGMAAVCFKNQHEQKDVIGSHLELDINPQEKELVDKIGEKDSSQQITTLLLKTTETDTGSHRDHLTTSCSKTICDANDETKVTLLRNAIS